MSQVQRTTNELIVRSLFLLGELGVDEEPDGLMLREGLYILNELLDQFSNSSIYVPYVTDLAFPLIVGKDVYSVSDIVTSDITADRIISLEYANYFVSTIVYPLKIINKAEYYNVVRLSNLQARIGFVFLDKQIQQSFLTFYPIPDQPYPVQIRCKLMLDKLLANTVITQVPPYFQRFLRYALCREFKSFYPSGNWTEQQEEEYTRMFNDLKMADEVDMTIRSSAIME